MVVLMVAVVVCSCGCGDGWKICTAPARYDREEFSWLDGVDHFESTLSSSLPVISAFVLCLLQHLQVGELNQSPQSITSSRSCKGKKNNCPVLVGFVASSPTVIFPPLQKNDPKPSQMGNV